MKIFIQIIKICGVILYALSCGFFLIPVMIPLYFAIFPPISGSLFVFCIVVASLIIVIMVLAYILFKKGKRLIATCLILASLFFFPFMIAIFIFYNHHNLSHKYSFENAPLGYYIEFSEETTQTIQFMHDLYVSFAKYLVTNNLYTVMILYVILLSATLLWLWWKKRKNTLRYHSHLVL